MSPSSPVPEPMTPEAPSAAPPAATTARTMRIFFRGLTVPCRIGVHDFERSGPQRVAIDIDLWVDRALADRAGGSDDLADTLDYDQIRAAAQTIASTRVFNTQEALCLAILHACLDQPPVRAARVATAKPDVYPDTAAVGVELYEEKPLGGP